MRARPIVQIMLVGVAVVGLAVDAWVHLSLASGYDMVRSGVLNQGDLFRVEGAAAILGAALLVLRPRRWTAAVVLVLSVAGVAAVLVYRYVDVGVVGPFPNMYEPVWYTKKTQSAWGEAATAVAALILLMLIHPAGRPATDLHDQSTHEGTTSC